MNKRILKSVILILSLILFTACGIIKSTSSQDIEATKEVEKQLTDFELGAVKAVKTLEGSLKNPESLQLHSITGKKLSADDTYYYKMDVSAQNGFGGMNRTTYYIQVYGSVLGSDLSDSEQALYKSMYDSFSNEVSFDTELILKNVNKK